MAKSKKKSKDVIPKRIAGVKVPKKVRRGRFGELLASKTGQALIAQAILGAGAVAAGLKAKDEPRVRTAAKDAKYKLADTAESGRDAASAVGATLAYAVGEGARAFAAALNEGHQRKPPAAEGQTARWTPDHGTPEAGTRQ